MLTARKVEEVYAFMTNKVYPIHSKTVCIASHELTH